MEKGYKEFQLKSIFYSLNPWSVVHRFLQGIFGGGVGLLLVPLFVTSG